MSHDHAKIGQPPWMPQKIMGRGQLDMTRQSMDKWSFNPVPREQVPRSQTTVSGHMAVTNWIGLETGSSRDGW
jgi:hypothetical protein